jgi:hypothetical protein
MRARQAILGSNFVRPWPVRCPSPRIREEPSMTNSLTAVRDGLLLMVLQAVLRGTQALRSLNY